MCTETLKGFLRHSIEGFTALFLAPGILAATIPSEADALESSSAAFSIDDAWHEDALTVGAPEESPQGAPRRETGPRRVFKDRITPHWFHNDTRFWYRNDLKDGAKEFILVNAERGTREVAFDHAKLAAALSQAAGAEYRADKVPFDGIEFIDESTAIRFNLGDTTWKCGLTSYECVKTEGKTSTSPASETDAPTSIIMSRRVIPSGNSEGPSSRNSFSTAARHSGRSATCARLRQ